MNIFAKIICLFLLINNSLSFKSKTIYELGNKWIYINYDKMNWYQSAHYCTAMGMQLLTLKTAEENFILSEYIKNNEPNLFSIWTSGNDLGKEGTFMWLSTGETIKYSNFTNSQPDNHSNIEHCLEVGYKYENWEKPFNYLYWNDIGCNRLRSFVCETRK